MTYSNEINEIKNIKLNSINEKGNSKIRFWEQLQLLTLALTIVGQCVIGGFFFLGQGIWLIANIISLIRDFKLNRPYADKVKNATMTAITIGIIASYLFLL